MQRRFIYFINPISGTGDKKRLRALINAKHKSAGFAYEIMATNAEAAYPGLQQKIATEGITDVVVCGGDGTVNQIVMATKNAGINIGIVPMGSGNGLALAAKIPVKAANAIDNLFTGKVMATDGFMINNRFSCMLCGLGFDAEVAHDFARQSKRGLVTYAKQTISHFRNAKTYPFRLTIDNELISVNAFFISVANSNQFGNNVTIAPRASIADGLIDIVVVKKMNKLRLLQQVALQIFMGKVGHPANAKKIEEEKVLYFQTAALRIENPAGALLHIDGDPAETAPVFDIKVLPGAFNLITGY